MKKIALLATVLLFAVGCPDEGDPVDPGTDAGWGVGDAEDADSDGDGDSDSDGDGDQLRAATIEFEEAEFIVEVGRTRRPEAVVFDQNGDVMEDHGLSWTSSNEDVIEISSGGFAIGNQLGESVLTAAAGEAEADWPARVVSARVARVDLIPANYSLVIGEEVQYLVNLRNASNATIDDDIPVQWSTTDESVATINADGLATGVSEGQVEVIALVDGVEDRANLTVSDVAVESIDVQPQSLSPIYPHQTIQLTGRVFDLEGTQLSGHTLTWESSDEGVATVNDNGLVTGVDAGSATITARLGELEDSVDVEVVFTMQRVASGGGFSCAVAIERLFCWGENDLGQLADGTTDSRQTAELADFTGGVQELSLGESHGCLIDNNDDIRCWGNNDHGQVGRSAGGHFATPQLVSASADFKRVDAGISHTCAISTADEVWCWGKKDRGQLGNNGSSTHQPQKVNASQNFSRVAVGESHTCAVSTGTETSAYCWGDNTRSQLGGSTGNASSSTPLIVDGGYTFTRITAGNEFTCGVSSSGPPVCWGAGDRGQLGNGDTPDRAIPRVLALEQGDSVSVIYAGAVHACALIPGGGTLCWGASDDGRLGFSIAGDVLSPEATDIAHVFNEIDVGETHACGRTSDYQAHCWGAAPGGGTNSLTIDFEY